MRTLTIPNDLSKPRFLFPLKMRIFNIVLCIFMITTLTSIVTTSIGQKDWIYLLVIMSIALILLGAMFFYITFKRQHITTEGFSTFFIKPIVTPWNSIVKVDALYEQNGLSFLILRDSKNKKHELCGSQKSYRPLFDEIKRAILDNNINYTIPNMPVFKHPQWPSNIVKAIQVITVLPIFILFPLRNQILHAPFYVYIIGFFAFIFVSRYLILIQNGFVDCDSSRIIFTTTSNRGRFEWNEVLGFTRIQKKKIFLLNYFELQMITPDGEKVIRTTNEDTFKEFEKIMKVFNQSQSNQISALPIPHSQKEQQ